MTTVEFDPFAGPAISRTAPSTEPQREIWTASQLGPEASLAYNESVTLRMRGALDVEALRAAFFDLVARHEALRSTFAADGTTIVVADRVDAPFEVSDLSSGDGGQTRLRRLLEEVVTTPFDLQNGPLVRAHVARLGAEEHAVVLTAHHIVCDGWSTAVLVRDWGALYAARAAGRAPDLAPAESFADYAIALRARAPEAAANEAYWVSRFAGEVPVLDLPCDRPRPPSRTNTSLREDRALPAELIAALKKVGGKERASLFAVLLAGWKALVFRLSGQRDLVIGIPAAGQSVGGHDALAGHCVSVLPLRDAIEPEAPFRALLGSVRGTLLDAFEHHPYTLGSLLAKLPIARDPARLPLVPVIFNVDRGMTPDMLPFPGLRVELSANPRRFETYEIFLNAVELGGEVILECQYNTDLFEGATVRRWLAAYERVLSAVAADPSIAVGKLPVVSDEERALTEQWSAAARLEVPDARVHDLIKAQAERTPDAVAVEQEGASLTYGELVRRAGGVARALQERGVGRGALVGLAVERAPAMVIGLVGILMSGAGYVPLDPDYPNDRLAFMASDAKLAALVTSRALAAELAAGVTTVSKVVTLEDVEPADPPRVEVGPEDVAYVIYTSGSTGKPKGVLVPHRAVVNLLESVRRTPGMREGDVVLAVTTLSFDIAVSEIVLPLVVGAKIVLATREVASDGARLLGTLRQSKPTFIDATPATYRLLLEAGWTTERADRVRTVICTGEAMPRDLASELVKRADAVWNGYGPTETTVWSTFWKVEEPVSRVLIGKAVANTEAWVLDAGREPAPLGAVGELWIGGRGVTLGYLGRPELTAERFVDNPFGAGKLYRTGDLVRRLPSGDLECLGRSDGQVKLRGYRIELGEIEDALAQHASVAQAAVIVREDRANDARLVGYAIAKGARPEDAALRAHLEKTLPAYMVPAHFVWLEKMPLTQSGKVDKKALPAPDVSAQPREDFVEPQTPTEKTLAAVWQEVLAVPRVSATDDFFALGGHSLLAAQMLSRLARDHGIALSLRRIFEAPTIRKLAALVDGGGKDKGSAAARIPKRPRPDRARQSLMQQRLWFLDRMEQGQRVYNLPSAFRLRGAYDHAAMERAFTTIVARHEPMRTTLAFEDNEPIQKIAEPAPARVAIEDLTKDPKREETLMRRLREETDVPFDLEQGPLWRARVFRVAPDDHVLFFMPHHAVWDGWSFDTLLRELGLAYGAYSKGREPELPPLPIAYADFSEWHLGWLEGDELERQSSYWKKKLSGPLPPLEVPTDRPRPAEISGRGGFVPLRMSRAEVDALWSVAKSCNATLYMLLVAAYTTLLHRWTGQTDLLVGTPIRGRTQPETEELIGFFVNTLVLRLDASGDPTLRELTERVRTTCLEAFAHPDMPFELLVKELGATRDLSRTPIFQAFFSFQDAKNRKDAMGDLAVTQVHVMPDAAQNDLVLWVMERNDGMVGGLSYNSDVFEHATMERMLAQFRTILVETARDVGAHVGSLRILPDAELAALDGFNKTAIAFDRAALAHGRFEAQARKTPEAIAVSGVDRTLAYADLDRRANRIAHALRKLGVRRGALVGVCMERTADMVAAVYGVLKAGAAYVPLDPGFPEDRLRFMVEDSGLRVVVGEGELAARLARGRELLVSEERIASMPETPVEGGDAAATPESPAYVIYTSGSTGTPKGVVVPHRAVVNFLETIVDRPGFAATDTLLAVTTLSFDIAVLELYAPLAVGARVVVASRDAVGDGRALLDAIRGNGVTVMQATPSTWRMLVEAGLEKGSSLKALCGGEAFPPELAEALTARAREVWNLYGPTETTVWSTRWKLPAGAKRVLIGAPIGNTQCHVLDARNQRAPIGVPGELCIGGDGVTTGYLGRPELTAERFVPDPFRGAPEARMYRTGDVARWLATGELEYIGRNDNQIKLRGYRIELGEIEARLGEVGAVLEACTSVIKRSADDARLVGYYVVRPGQSVTQTEIRKVLRKGLPDYMVPQHFMELPSLPRTPNGKIDRKALPTPFDDAPKEAAFVAPRSDNERLLAAAWEKAIGVAAIGVHDNFFNAGGHSLLVLQVIAEVEKTTGVRLQPRSFVLDTLEQMASQLPSATPSTPTFAAAPAPREDPKGTLAGLFDRVKKRLRR